MAGDPIYDTTPTSISVEGTSWTTTQGEYTDTTSGYDTYTIVRSMNDLQEEIYKKVKQLIKQAAIQKMKDDWVQKPRHMKPFPIMRPSHRLQNVCFGGRGWA